MYFAKFLIFSFAILSIVNLSQQCLIKIENDTKFDLKRIGSLLNRGLPNLLKAGETADASINLNLIGGLNAIYSVGDTGNRLTISTQDLYDSLEAVLKNLLSPEKLLQIAKEVIEIEATCSYGLSIVESEDGKVAIQAKIYNEAL